MSEAQTSLPTLAVLGGTGKEGPGLALRWVLAGYPVIIGSRQLEKAQATAEALSQEVRQYLEAHPEAHPGSITGLENSNAARQADISILTVVAVAHQPALESLKDDLKGKILVDATARVDFRDPRPPAPPAAARLAQELIPEARVVAAFQNVPAHSLKKNLGGSLRADVLVCADDLDAAKAVIALTEAIGLRAYYAGGLDNALVVESLTCLLIGLNKYYGTKTASISISGIPNPAAS
jgi:hypothetical protein